MRSLIFALIELALRPFQKLARIGYASRLRRHSLSEGISGTADVPLLGRVLMHQAGTRRDEAAARLAPHLPSLSRPIVVFFNSAGLASRWSGYRPASVAFPAARPSTRVTMMAHRSEFFDRSLAAATAADAEPPVGQVVILGAGWDTRAYGSPAASRLRFFEVDMAPTLAAKRAALERAGLPTGYVAFVETDFNQTSWYRALVEQGFDPALPAFILWEGVTMYVGEDAVDATLRQVAELAPGSRIAFDYWSRELMCSEAPFERDGQEVQAGMKFYGEAFIYGIPTKAPARDPVERLLISHGLELADFEPMGPDGKIHGGLALAICRGFSPARPSPPR